ncbi:hypothetical protein QFZ74_004910 [Streptomyces sp. V3I7]|nr:hypothetical protein [Streptomyces sp. V3I7]
MHGGGARIDRPALLVQHLRTGLVRVLVADHPPRPVQEQPPVRRRNAQQVGEVEQRVLVGDGGDDVDGAVTVAGRLQRGGQQRAGTPAREPREPVHPPRREGPAHEPSQPSVLRRILIEHHAPDEGQVGRIGVPDLGGAEARGVRRRVLQHPHHVRVPGHRPEAGTGRPAQHLRLLLPGHRTPVSQHPVVVVRHPGRVPARIEDVGNRLTGQRVRGHATTVARGQRNGKRGAAATGEPVAIHAMV